MGDVHEGQILAGKYRIERVLGEGGMGRVVAAVHEQLHQRVAIKFLLPEAMAMPEAVERFLREARASVRLRSEHVGRVIDVGTLEDGAPYIVMEFLEGTDLDGELARRKALPPVEAIDYVLQACEAIAEAHSHGLVHRDIKPANLFLTRRADGSPLIKVLDFGIAKAAPTDPSFNMTRTRAVMGSPGYMSPEQLRSSRRVDARSDIWSLGIVLYQLLSGRQPFGGETFSDLCINIATEAPAPLAIPGLSPDLAAAIMRCLEKDPAHRYQNVAELAAALEPFAHTGRGAAARIARVLQVPTAAAPAPSGAVPRHAQPTTLSSAASEQRHPPATASRRGAWLAGVAALAVIAVAAVVMVAVSGGASPSAAPATPDAAIEAESVEDAATMPTASLPGDAAPVIPDATPITPDAAPAEPKRTTRRDRPRTDKKKTKKKKGVSGLDLDLDTRQ